MSAYLRFFELERPPFGESSSSRVVLGTKAIREALARIRSGLEEDASRICVSGGAGVGKTSLARALPKLLGDGTRVAVILDPEVPWDALRDPIARQWGLAEHGLARTRLVEAAREHRLVLVVDRAESASEEMLDHLDVLLSYRSEDERPVVQSVLLANLDVRPPRQPGPLVWWLDRIHTLQLELSPLSRASVAGYIEKHLKRAGRADGLLFSVEAAHAIHEQTGGVPSEIGRLCERLLGEAARLGLAEIDAELVYTARFGLEPTGTPVDDGKPQATRPIEETEIAEETDEPTTSAASAEPDPVVDAASSDAITQGRDDPEETAACDGLLSHPTPGEERGAFAIGGWTPSLRGALAVAAVLVLTALGLLQLRPERQAAQDLAKIEPGGSTETRASSKALRGDRHPTVSPARTSEARERRDRTSGGPPILARLRGPVLVEPLDGRASDDSERPRSAERDGGDR
ncbi:MAG: ExeA family protein [bacterium]